MSPAAEGGPLTGLTILDLTQFLAGPFCGQILGDLGARVIKVEPPPGEMTRSIPPHFVGDDSAYFASVNRNKESIILDLKRDSGRDLLLRLIGKADGLLESNRPGVMEALGLGFAQLHKANPRLVLVSITGFGQDGPYRTRPAYDAIVQALAGVMSITGEEGGQGVRTGIPIGDLAAGMFGAIGCLAALHEVQATGKGRHVDVAMLDAQIALLSYLGVYYLLSNEVPGPQGRGHVSIPTYRAFTCADGVDIMVTAITDKMWVSLCQAIGSEALASDERFNTSGLRLANREELSSILEAAFGNAASDHWLETLGRLDIPVAPVNTIDKALADPQVKHREMVVTIQGAAGGSLKLLGNPIRTRGNQRSENTWPPQLGEHTDRVLGELLGLTTADLASLHQAGIVRATRTRRRHS